jgi:hypothetical protein
MRTHKSVFFLLFISFKCLSQIPCPDGYYCEVVKVHDGDTYTLNCNLGNDIFLKSLQIRLYGVDTPELITLEGQQIKDCIQLEILPIGTIVYASFIKTKNGQAKKEKFGRFLCNVKRCNDNLDLTDYLVNIEFSKSYFGGKKQ